MVKTKVSKSDQRRADTSFQVCHANYQLQIARYYNLAGDDMDPHKEMDLFASMTHDAHARLATAEIRNDGDYREALLYCSREDGDMRVPAILRKAIAYHRKKWAENNKVMADLAKMAKRQSRARKAA